MMKVFIAVICAMICATSCMSGSKTVKGKVIVTGNEPFTECVIITSENRKYRIKGSKEALIRRDKQNAEITVKGNITAEPAGMKFGEIEVVEIVEGR